MPSSNFKKEDALLVVKKNEKGVQGITFDELVSYIKGTETYKEQETKIIIKDDTIYFGHHLPEIKAAFPKLVEGTLGHPARWNPEHISIYESPFNHVFLHLSLKITDDCQLVKNAEEFFSQAANLKHDEFKINIDTTQSPEQNIIALLKDFPSLIIGEAP